MVLQTTMDLELVKFINSDLTWNAVKKGHRSTTRRPRRPATKISEYGTFDYEKSGVAILGQHFGEEVLEVPIKKRILMLQSTPSLRARSAQPQLPSPHHEESELPTGSENISHSNSIKSKNELAKKEVPDLNDFSGIELLAAAAVACHSSVIEEHTTPRVESYTDGVIVKDDIAPIDSDDSSVQDSTIPINGESDKNIIPSKEVRLHWDLNTVMDEWEEPCCDILIDPLSEKGYSKDLTTHSQVTKGDQDQEQDQDQDQEQVKSVSEVVQGGCHDDKVTSEDRLSDCCGSNTVDKVKAGGGGGYDSPVEDGELRDTWQKNEVEEMECVDYESDNIYEDNFDTIESVNNEVIGALSEIPINKIEQDDKSKVPELSQSVTSEEKDRVPSFGVIKNDSFLHRTRSENIQDSYSRGKRDFGQEKSMGRDGSSNHGWDSRNTQRYPRPKHVIGGSRNTHPINYNNPRGSYKTFNTRPERNESYGIYKSNSRDRFKGGLGFHLQGSRREDYNNGYLERKVSSFSPNFNHGAHLSRPRKRSRSRSRTRSRSRSRSRSESPIAWHFQKKKNVDTKRESPDYRADVRDNINGQYRERRASFHDLGRLKSYPQAKNVPNRFEGNDEKYGGRFGYNSHLDESFKTRNTRIKDNGFRYARNENRYPLSSHKDDLHR